jgi:choline dehydrogenase
LENLVPDSENQTTNGHIDPAVHGYNGTLPVAADYTIVEFNEKILEASRELSEEFPFKLDMNDGEPIGISKLERCFQTWEMADDI